MRLHEPDGYACRCYPRVPLRATNHNHGILHATATDVDARWELFDVVRLVVDLPERGLRRGGIGAIVIVHEQPELAREVELTDGAGRTRTRALLALRPEQLERVSTSQPEHER